MAGELLLDTPGALVSLLDRSQRDHAARTEFPESRSGPVLSTEAVLTKATHLLGGLSGGRRACIDFFLAGGALLVRVTLVSLGRARQPIDQYAGLPMDYADAMLVVLAEELGSALVLTTDRRDFGVYRMCGRRRVRIVPDVRR